MKQYRLYYFCDFSQSYEQSVVFADLSGHYDGTADFFDAVIFRCKHSPGLYPANKDKRYRIYSFNGTSWDPETLDICLQDYQSFFKTSIEIGI
jgi:hypothetical protein